MQGKRAVRTPIDGVLVLDKPLGLSSNAAMVRARRLFDARKAGHGGTLDPLATGVLPVLFGEATKFAADLLEADKTYEATLALGTTTTTGDAEGEIIEQRPVRLGEDGPAHQAVRAACDAFVGDIEQVPPMHSALKRDGRPLYAYAREGVVLERSARRVRIHAIELLGTDVPAARLTLRVHCSKGTYVRTLAEDIGARLGCGAHLAALRRTAAGPVSIGQAVTPDALEAMPPEQRAARLLPADALLQSLPRIELAPAEAERFGHGQRIGLPPAVAHARPRGPLPASQAGVRVRVYGPSRLLGTAELAASGLLVPLRLIAQPPN